MYISLFIVALLALTGCHKTDAEEVTWPDLSFIVLDESPGQFIFERTVDVAPTVDRVILLPIVENYLWNGKRHHIAVADPFAVEPGKDTLGLIMSDLEKDSQVVRECIVLAPGYCPGTLQPVINYAASYAGKQVWLVELARISEPQFHAVFDIMTNELSQTFLTVTEERAFETALQDRQLISSRKLLSPIPRDGFRNGYVLWSLPTGTKVSVCLSPEGKKLLAAELLGVSGEGAAVLDPQ